MLPDQCVYVGKVMHKRMYPKISQFEYKVFSIFLDIDKIEQTIKSLKIMKYNKFGILSFNNKDHGKRDGTVLRKWVDKTLKKNGRPFAEKVFLLCFPRMYGYVFNPISIYFCYNNGNLDSVICEVKNTFGDQVIYVLSSEDITKKVITSSKKKEMYVSPFIEMEQIYDFFISPPDKRLSFLIKQKGKEGLTLIARHQAKAFPLTDYTLYKCIIFNPLMTLKVISAIHWQAFKLFLKGIKYIPYPGKFDFRNDKLK